MKVKIHHLTHYQYMERVFLEPHVIRLTPRPDPHVQILEKSIEVSPAPSRFQHIIENEGASSAFVCFEGMTHVLEIETHMVIQVQPFNPFDFLIYPISCTRVPMAYPRDWSPLLHVYMEGGDDMEELKTFALKLADDWNYETVALLIGLCRVIYDDFVYEKRQTGSAYSPLKTLKDRKGSCRDFTVFAMAVCRQLGMACRYVSGYYLNESGPENGELHGWMEVFLPGVGWKGFDPTLGIACDHRHVALSASANPAMTLPVTGSFRGFTSSRMQAQVTMEWM